MLINLRAFRVCGVCAFCVLCLCGTKMMSEERGVILES